MNNKKLIPIITIIIILLAMFSGCTDSFFNISTTYEKHPTKISYTILYGYNVTCNGTGKYTITYNCDIPSLLFGSLTYSSLYSRDYESKTIVNNDFLSWNISGDDQNSYKLGIGADVIADTFFVSDLNGEDALTIKQINDYYGSLSKKYMQVQSDGADLLIDPKDNNIRSVAQYILDTTETDNSFVISKELFIWLKENTDYKTHNTKGSVQPAAVTLSKKTGDCDDLSFLYISLCRSVGIPARFIRGYLLSEDDFGEVFATPHAWSEVFVGGSIGNDGWIPVECACQCDEVKTQVNQNFGIENAYHLRLFVDDGTNESLNVSLSGLLYSYFPGRVIDLESFNIIEDYVEIESKKLTVSGDNQRSYKN